MIQALNDVRARMAEVGAQLPPGTTSITERQTPSVFPIISFVVTGGRDPASLHDYAYYDLRPRISRIADVSYVTVQGGDIREILVEVDPQALVAAGLSIADVADRLGKEHRLKAVGRIDREMLQYQVLADTLATDPLDLENRVIAHKNSQSIRLRDLGRVTISHEDRTMAIRANGKNAVALTVFRRLGGNALAVSRDLNAVLADAAKSAPPGVSIRPIYDQGLLVQTAIANVRDAIVIGGVLSVVILLLFLKSIRATLIAALSIPLSLIISFVFLHLTGDTLNLMSLGGLAVAIGLIIDDTVVVIENIARHLAEGQTGDEAVDRASKEISGAVIGSTLTTILVFLPLAFVRGVVGQFFQSLSLALTVALLVSMVVSLTIIPVLAARFLGRRPMPTTGPIYNFLADRYEGLLKAGLRFPEVRRAALASGRGPAWWLASNLETGFMPEMDEGAFVLDYNMPVGTSLNQTDKVLRRVEAVLLETPDISGYIRRTGAELGLFRHRELYRRHPREPEAIGRRRPMEEIFEALREELQAEVPELETEFVPLVLDQIGDLRGWNSLSKSRSSGRTPRELRELAAEVGKDGRKVEGVVDVNTHVLLGNPDIVVRPDSIQTARVGLTELDVESQLNAALYGQVASTVPEQDRMTKIRVRYPDRVRYDRENLRPVADQPAMATPGPVSRTAGIGFRATGPARDRSESSAARTSCGGRINSRSLTVTGDLDKRDLGSVNRETTERSFGALDSCRLSLRAGGGLPGTARIVREPRDGARRRGGPGFSASRLSVSQPDACRCSSFWRSRFRSPGARWPSGSRHAAERVVVHGINPSDRAGREERHHPDRVHRPAQGRRGYAAARGAAQGRAGRGSDRS